MKVLRVVGPSDAGKTTLVERLVDRLSERGRVGTVKHIDCDPDLDTEGKDTARHRSAGAVRTEGIATGGDWFATGDERTLADALDDLATTCDYALVEGYGEADLPTVALGDPSVEDPLVAASTVDEVDVDAVVDAMEGTDAYETLASLVDRVRSAADAERDGAIATFTGRVRTRDASDDTSTDPVEAERHDAVATQEAALIREDLRAREGVHEVLIHHETGIVETGEEVVSVVVLAGHRRAAFETVAEGIDRLEEEVPLYETEVTVDETSGVDER